jgi:hypothetical protein
MRTRWFCLLVAILALASLGATRVPRPTTDSLRADLHAIASDATGGRDNGTAGSLLTQNYLIGQLKQIAHGLDTSKSGDDAFKQAIPGGTNLLAVIPGSELPNEFVVVGAHYDHLGHNCRTSNPGDTICNGATDNAAGDANVLAIGRAIAGSSTPPRRSVILALWDREEDGLLGSQYYVQHPLRPLSNTVGYVNYDIQGANLLPSLRNDTFAVGAESGGAPLEQIVKKAGHTGLKVHQVSSIFGEGRRDYVNFIAAGVPTVFYSDSTGPCYHTAQDDIDVVDFTKLQRQARIGISTVLALVNGDRVPFVGSNPIATYADAVALKLVTVHSTRDLKRFSPSDQASLLKFRDDVHAIVRDGAANFGNDDVNTLLGDAASAINILSTGTCDGFLRR